MSKVVINNTASPILIADTGVTLPASGSYTIPQSDYLLWASSSNIITYIGNGNVTINDGANNLSASQGTALLQGAFPTEIITDSNMSSSSYPDPSAVIGLPAQSNQDAFGNTLTRGAVLTDEGSFRDDFSGTALATALNGTISVVNGNVTVNGTGTTFTTQVKQFDYIKVTSHTEAMWTQVSYVVSNTQLVLIQGYLGATATSVAGQFAHWETTTATGGSIVVANSTCTIASGTTSGQNCNIIKIGDYLPYSSNFYLSVSQRIANQNIAFGFVDVFPSPDQQCIVQLNGTVNTIGNFVTSFSAQATDIQTTAFTFPAGGNSSTLHTYRVDLGNNQATLSIDGVVVAINTIHLPSPYTNLQLLAGITNTAAAASSTSLVLDYVFFNNIDRIQIDADFQGEPIPVSALSLPLPTGAAQDGTDSTGVVQLTGGVGIRGWLSGIFSKLSGTLTTSVSNFPATQPISAAALPLPSGAASAANQTTLGSHTTKINDGTNTMAVKAASTAAAATDPSAVVALSPNSPVPLSSLTKGTQGATGITTQDLKDAGRNVTNYYMANQVVSTATDTLMSLTGYKSSAAVVATTTPAVVTSGKTYRITSIQITYVAIATAGTVHFTLRANTGGVAALASPAVNEWVIGASSAVAGVSQTVAIPFPDGLEFAAGTGIGVSMQGFGATGTAAAVGYGSISIYGYEY